MHCYCHRWVFQTSSLAQSTCALAIEKPAVLRLSWEPGTALGLTARDGSGALSIPERALAGAAVTAAPCSAPDLLQVNVLVGPKSPGAGAELPAAYAHHEAPALCRKRWSAGHRPSPCPPWPKGSPAAAADITLPRGAGARALLCSSSLRGGEVRSSRPAAAPGWLGTQPFQVSGGCPVIKAGVMSRMHKDIHSRRIVQLACNVHVNKAIKVYKYSALPYSL